MNKIKEKINSNFRECTMCGKFIPPADSYPAEQCWMCVRECSERGHHRYYVRSPEGFWEEVQELAGLFAFSKENEPIIKEEMEKKRQILEAEAQERKMREARGYE